MVIKYNILIIIRLLLDWRFRSIVKQEIVTDNSDVKFNLV